MPSRPAQTLLAFFYRCSEWVFRILHTGTQIAFEGFWMGMLPDAAVDVVSVRSYGDGSDYTADAYLDSGFQFWEDLAVKRFFTPGSAVLVAAAGGGRELIALERAGYRAEGFECSPAMVATGKKALARRGLKGTLSWAPPCSAPVSGRLYDAMIVG